MRHVLLWMDAHYWTSFGLLKKNIINVFYKIAIIKLGRARTIFNIT